VLFAQKDWRALQQYFYRYISLLLCPCSMLPVHRDYPAKPWQQMFSERLRLSVLTELETAYGPCWEATDLDRLVSSCSRLQKLSLRCTPGLQLTALLQLTDLCSCG